MNQNTVTHRRDVITAISATSAVALAGCSGLNDLLGDDSDVEDSDGDGVIDSEDYAPNDPDVQERADVSGGDASGGGGPGDDNGGADDTDPTATADESTPTDPEPTPESTDPEPTPTTADPTTVGLSCETVVQETVDVESGSAATYRVSLHEGARLEVTGITQSGQEPGLSVIAPSGRRVVDDAFGQTVRETVTATESGTYIVQFNNGAWLPETGTWEVQIVACTR